ncbi:MAG: HAMP domain-containing sensor histidine kinase [Pseudomonadota bacterium]
MGPTHWSISKKISIPPVALLGLIGLIVFFGWSMADEHQRLLSQSYQEHSTQEEAALRLPHTLARIQRDLYKLTIWAQIDVEGSEVNSTRESIGNDLNDVSLMLSTLEGQPLYDRLDEAVRRYNEGVGQALLLIQRSPRVGATATRGMERVYLEADEVANLLATSAEEQFRDRLHETRTSWRSLVTKFLIMFGLLACLVPLLALGSRRMIAIPIENLASVVDKLRQGQLDVDVPWTDRHDEIGLVARAVEAFRENLIRYQTLEREREQLNQELERKVEKRTQQLAEQKERLAQALEKEHQLNGLQRQFVSMVCHEFRTPLAIIDGNAQRIMKRRETIAPERLMGGLGKVRVSVRRLTELMESVLSASKLEAGSIKMDLAPCDLVQMIEEVVANYREVNPSYEITADLAKLPDRFIVDVKLMRQVVSNLLSNAVKYSPDDAHVSIKAESCIDGGVTIAVRDQGVGIPEEELKKLFQRFYRASTSTGIAGTGIGLHMVQALVDMHGGRIDVASEVDVGTTFTVYLPQRDDVGAPDCDKITDAA